MTVGKKRAKRRESGTKEEQNNSRQPGVHVSSRGGRHEEEERRRASYERQARFIRAKVGRVPVKARKFKGTILERCTASLLAVGTGQVRRASDASNQGSSNRRGGGGALSAYVHG